MLHENEGNFRALVENAHDGIVILTNDGCACYANKRACMITGYSNDELTAANFEDVAHRDGNRNLVQSYRMMIAGEPETVCMETRLVNKQGEALWIELSSSKTVWKRQAAVLVIFRDISERKCMEEALMNSGAELKCMVQKRDLELKTSVRDLKRKCKELSMLKIEGEKVNNELLETNNALSILASKINGNRLDAEKTVAGTLNSKIMPIIDNLRKSNKIDDIQSGLDVLEIHLQTLIKELMGEMNTAANLTPSEVQIATMIKNGLKSREIAEKFYISPQTVKTHRRNIRKKLHIHSPNISLATYLRFMMV